MDFDPLYYIHSFLPTALTSAASDIPTRTQLTLGMARLELLMCSLVSWWARVGWLALSRTWTAGFCLPCPQFSCSQASLSSTHPPAFFLPFHNRCSISLRSRSDQSFLNRFERKVWGVGGRRCQRGYVHQCLGLNQEYTCRATVPIISPCRSSVCSMEYLEAWFLLAKAKVRCVQERAGCAPAFEVPLVHGAALKLVWSKTAKCD